MQHFLKLYWNNRHLLTHHFLKLYWNNRHLLTHLLLKLYSYYLQLRLYQYLHTHFLPCQP